MERVRGYFGRVNSGQHRRTSTPSTYLEFSANIVTSTRYQEQWEEIETMLTNRMKANIHSGYFNAVMQNPGPYITHTHAQERRGRTLSSLATDSASVDLSSLEDIGYQAYSLEGNMPTGQPTSVPLSLIHI